MNRDYITNRMNSLRNTNINDLSSKYEIEVDDIASTDCQYKCFQGEEQDDCPERYITFWVPLQDETKNTRNRFIGILGVQFDFKLIGRNLPNTAL
jgi:hypothetical protein